MLSPFPLVITWQVTILMKLGSKFKVVLCFCKNFYFKKMVTVLLINVYTFRAHMTCSLHRWEIAARSLWLNDTLIPHLITTEGISPLHNLDKNLNFMILNANLDVNSSTRQAFKTNRANHIIFVYTTLMLLQVSSSKGCQFKHLAAKTTKEGGMIT